MSTNKIAMTVMYRKQESVKSPGYGKYYAEVDRAETLSLDGLVEHLRSHNCAVGVEAIKAVIVKLSECVPELVAQGIPVKIDGLGTFYPSIKNVKHGATEALMLDKQFNPSSMIQGVSLRFLPESTALNNLTSRAFYRDSVSPSSQYIVRAEERVVNGKTVKVQTRKTIEDFRNPADSPEP